MRREMRLRLIVNMGASDYPSWEVTDNNHEEKIMPNQKERKKKGGRNKSKKVQAMRRSEEIRKAHAKPKRPSTDQPDIQRFKPGAADDQYTRRGAG
jgi:hypothetical protein